MEELKPSEEELNKVRRYEIEKNKIEDSIVCQPLQYYLEMLIALVHEETGEWFFYVDIASIINDFVIMEIFPCIKQNLVIAFVLRNRFNISNRLFLYNQQDIFI